jgi:3-hydroxyisobutyrate dehydrogenase-like beta-hydroxyacid dehydrogenase
MTETTTRRTGFIGLGSQGAPIAERMLLAGHPLTVWARRPESAQDLVGKGAVLAASIEAVAQACDYVGVCVVDDAGVEDVCGKLIPKLEAGSVLVIHSTILPSTCEDLARRCADAGIQFLDAPVSGGSPAASAGTLTVMCGGTSETFADALPLLQTFGSKIVLLGPPGSAQRAKIINNSLMAANMGLAFSALNIAERIGVDRAALSDLIKHSSGRSFGFEVFARLPAAEAFAHGAKLLLKDVELLGSILGHDAGANALATAALPFLDATGATRKTDR